jgi:hypothetical protein
VRQPALAVYAIIREARDLFPGIDAMDSSDRARAARMSAVVRREASAAMARVRREMPAVRIVEVPGARHAVFRSHPELVYREMTAFLARAPGRH